MLMYKIMMMMVSASGRCLWSMSIKVIFCVILYSSGMKLAHFSYVIVGYRQSATIQFALHIVATKLKGNSFIDCVHTKNTFSGGQQCTHAWGTEKAPGRPQRYAWEITFYSRSYPLISLIVIADSFSCDLWAMSTRNSNLIVLRTRHFRENWELG